MKYELMALVNEMARKEKFPGLAERFADIYDELNTGITKPDPVSLGKYLIEINDNFFTQVKGVEIEEKQQYISPSAEYKKPFFVDPDEIIREQEQSSRGDRVEEYEDFINDMFRLLGLTQPRNAFQDNMRNRMGMIKKAVHQLKKDSIELSWVNNPERMGK